MLFQKKSFLNSTWNCSYVLMMEILFPNSNSLCHHHSMTISERCHTTVLILFSSLFPRLHLKEFSIFHKKFSTSCTSWTPLNIYGLGSSTLASLSQSTNDNPLTFAPSFNAFISAFMVAIVFNVSMS